MNVEHTELTWEGHAQGAPVTWYADSARTQRRCL